MNSLGGLDLERNCGEVGAHLKRAAWKAAIDLCRLVRAKHGSNAIELVISSEPGDQTGSAGDTGAGYCDAVTEWNVQNLESADLWSNLEKWDGGQLNLRSHESHNIAILKFRAYWGHRYRGPEPHFSISESWTTVSDFSPFLGLFVSRSTKTNHILTITQG